MDTQSVTQAAKGGTSGQLTAEDLLKVCLEEGADDAGFVVIGREALSGERGDHVQSRIPMLILHGRMSGGRGDRGSIQVREEGLCRAIPKTANDKAGACLRRIRHPGRKGRKR